MRGGVQRSRGAEALWARGLGWTFLESLQLGALGSRHSHVAAVMGSGGIHFATRLLFSSHTSSSGLGLMHRNGNLAALLSGASCSHHRRTIRWRHFSSVASSGV